MRSLADLNTVLNYPKNKYHRYYNILVVGNSETIKRDYNKLVGLFVDFLNNYFKEKIGSSHLPFFDIFKIKESDYELKNKNGQGLEFYFHSESGNSRDGYRCHFWIEIAGFPKTAISIPESAEAGIESGICYVALSSSFILYIKTNLNFFSRAFAYLRFKVLMRIFGYKIKRMKE
jgi:hypothetical protein